VSGREAGRIVNENPVVSQLPVDTPQTFFAGEHGAEALMLHAKGRIEVCGELSG